eukprot:8444400-Pyramimonas_sp.AAC.1
MLLAFFNSHAMRGESFGSASGRPAKACALLRATEQPGTTFEGLQWRLREHRLQARRRAFGRSQC